MKSMKTYQRQFGQYLVEVEGYRVAIIGDWNSNFGHFYETEFTRFKAHPKGESHDWNRPQVLGMEWDYGLTPKVKDWLYGLVLKDRI